MTQFPSTFHPNIDSMLAKTYVLSMARRPFTVHDKDWKLVCMLCTKLPTIENGLAVPEDLPNGKKGIAVTYTIRPGAVWGDRTPVSTSDVLFTYEVGRHPQSGVAAGELYRRILKIDVKDAKTFTLHFDRITYNYNDINGFDLIPAHLDRPKFAEPAEYKNRTVFDTDTTNPGLYFGPYRITEKVTGSYVVLEPNPTWWGKTPYFRRIVIKVIGNTAALEANLLSGSIDYIAGELGLSLDQAIAFEKRHGKKYNIRFKPGLIYEHLDVNLDNPVLRDRRVRRALIYALDREAINKQLFDGRQPVAATFVHPLDWIYTTDTPLYRRDLKKARALLDAAGWTVKRKGVRTNGAGKRLAIELMTTAGNRSRELVQQVLQSQWRDIGVATRIRNEPARVYFGETVTKRKFTGLAMFAWLSAPENVPRSILHSKEIPTAANNYSGQNYMGYANAEVDELLEAIEVELDRDKRRALWHRLQRIYASELPVIPLFFRADAYIMPKWLKGIEPTGHQYPTSTWVENWRAER
ncbi:MAG: peptide ABC transporter substrate-binding protein [Proteobacteria bacterium]|nr:peptide ABC transporter substrate-binding protein [Pseudomonadota bacterium]